MLLVGNKELNVLGVFRVRFPQSANPRERVLTKQYGPGVYYLSIDLVSRGLVDLKPLITHK